jgi:hypothetical protein
MKTVKKISIVFLTLMFFSCYKNPVERNTIVFKDKNQEVEDSIVKLTELLKKFPKSNTVFNTNYYFEENKFFINNSYVGDYHNLNLDTIKSFSKYNSSERTQFINITKFLNENYLSSGYLDDYLDQWSFVYRYIPDGDFHDTRDLIFFKVSDSVQLKSHYKILDHKNNIFLLAPIDADIR